MKLKLIDKQKLAENLAKNLVFLIEKSNLSRAAFADEVGLASSFIYYLIYTPRCPHSHVLYKISKYAKVSMEDLLEKDLKKDFKKLSKK
jgi:hypothetical protein